MRISLHGHRPAYLRPQPMPGAAWPGDGASASADASGSASATAATGQTVRNVNLGFFKLKIHRQTPLQAALVNQLAQRQVDNHAAPAEALSRHSSGRSAGNASDPSDAVQAPDAPEATPLASRVPVPNDHDAADLPVQSVRTDEDALSDASMSEASLPQTARSRTGSDASEVPLGSFTATVFATSSAHTAPFSRNEYIAQWNAWAEGGDTAGRENRPEAVNRMTRWLDVHSTTANRPPLDLSMLRLRSLPENLPPGVEDLRLLDNDLVEPPEHLPSTLMSLDLSRSRSLTRLPDNLPAGLTSLHAEECFFRRLPDHLPASLVNLNVAENWLTRLPDHLPAGLRTLNVGLNPSLTALPEQLPESLELLFAESCGLTHLPEHLPASLQELDVRGNRLTRLPESLTAPRSTPCIIELSNNPLAERVRNRLSDVLNAPGYQGPRVHFSMHDPHQDHARARRGQPRALHQSVASWMTPTATDAAGTARRWNGFEREPGAAAFSQLLDRLQDTVNFGNPDFQRNVADWLLHLGVHPQLRQDTFMLSQGATTSCEDRVTLTFNAMRQLRLAHDVEQGHYDERLPELLTLARGIYRLEQLEGIAREKTASLNYVDEIEVYLAYQVKLRESLTLPLETPDMRYFRVSYVTQADLEQAQERVLASESQHFADYLATDWRPWQSVIQRLAPEHHAQAQDELIEAMGDEFTQRLQARLQAMELENDADAQRSLGPQVQTEIASEINGRLTRDFLASRGLLAHIEPPPANPPRER